MAEANITNTEFFGTPIRIIDHANRRWLTAEEAGRCLGYNEGNARQGVNNLYSRHQDEFAEDDTCVISLMTQGQGRELRIFSDTGCIKLGFFSSTPRAKDFRTWAAKFLAANRPTQGESNVVADWPKTARLLGQPRMTRHLERVACEMFVAGHLVVDIAKHLGVSRTTASLVLHAKYQFGPNSGTPECSPELIAAVAARHLALEQERLAMHQERIAQRYLSHSNNQALAKALEQVGHQLQRRPAVALANNGED